MSEQNGHEGFLYINGVNGASGGYLLPPLQTSVVAALAQGETLEPQEIRALKARYGQATGAVFGVVEGVDPARLADAGWGVIFAHGADPAVREALEPLLRHRQQQAAVRRERYYQEYIGPSAYRPGESLGDFLVRHKVTPGQPANPERMPYYLLLVGDPEAIPYRFQYLLDVVYAVGRIHFDTPEEYAQYANNVVSAELGPQPLPRAVFFGVENPDDLATGLSADHLVAPLARNAAAAAPDWSVRQVASGAATKARLETLLGGNETPAFFFSASHGMGFPNGDPRQLAHQGALLCQDWPGPEAWSTSIPPDFYFAGDDISADARLSGLIAFFFACYGAGTPHTDDFAMQSLGMPTAIAPHAFVSRLPQRLLAHPNGALAVIGHVERAWTYSFSWPRIGEQVDAYDSTVKLVLKGAPVGFAMEYLNNRHAALSTQLESEKEDIAYGKMRDDVAISSLWTAKNDARNSVIIGDPAVRLGVTPRA
jgi:hypothetical protein